MTSVNTRYAELVALTQFYLMQEYKIGQHLPTTPETYHFFRKYVLQKNTIQHPTNPSPPKSQSQQSQSQPKPPQTSQQIAPKITPKPISTPSPTPVANQNESQPIFVNSTPPSLPDKPLEIPPKNHELAKTAKENIPFSLEPYEVHNELDFKELRKIIKEKLPHLTLLDTIPNDTEALQKAKRWEQKTDLSQVIILSFDENTKHQSFLSNIAKALKIYGISANVVTASRIEQEKGWNALLETGQLQLIIASSYGLYALPELLKHYREVAKNAKYYLGKTPLLLLSDLSFYFKEPGLKSSLWKALKDLLALKTIS
jgi:hypothetical protein